MRAATCRAAAAVAVTMAVLAACGGSQPASTPADLVDATPTTGSVTTAPPVATWTRLGDGPQLASRLQPALRDDEGGAWLVEQDSRSTDEFPPLVVWEASADGSWRRHELPTWIDELLVWHPMVSAIARTGDAVAVVASADIGPLRGPPHGGGRVGIVWWSVDGAATWSAVFADEVSTFGTALATGDGRFVIGGALGGALFDGGWQPHQPAIWRLEPGESLVGEPVATALPDGSNGYAAVSDLRLDDGGLLAFGAHGDASGGASYRYVTWREVDGEWVEAATGEAAACGWQRLAAGAATFVTACAGNAGFDAGVWKVSIDGSPPKPLTLRFSFGSDSDGRTPSFGLELAAPVADGVHAFGRAWGPRRSSVGECFADVATCRRWSFGLVTVADGRLVEEVAVPGDLDVVLVWFEPADHSLRVLTADLRSSPPHATSTWALDTRTGGVPRREHDPVPELPLPVVDGPLALGERYIGEVAGGCGPWSVTIEGQRWETGEPLRPTDGVLPFRTNGMVDAPDLDIFGVLVLEDEQTLRLETLDGDVVAEFAPVAPEDARYCGPH